MPAPLLHVGATVTCSHNGQSTPSAPNPRVLVSGQPTTLQTAPWVVAGCSLPPNAGGPCVTAQWVTGTVRVLSNGQPLLMMINQAACVPTATPLIPAVSQVRVLAT